MAERTRCYGPTHGKRLFAAHELCPCESESGEGSTQGIRRLPAPAAQAIHSLAAEVDRQTRSSFAGLARRQAAGLSPAFGSDHLELENRDARLVRRSAQPDDGPGRR